MISHLNYFTRKIIERVSNVFELIIGLPYLYMACIYVRYFGKKEIDVGIGPEPLINNVYHKKALLQQGYTVETFVNVVYFIIDEFDYRGDKVIQRKTRIGRYLRKYAFFIRAVSRYRCIYFYFNGGPLFTNPILKKYEPKLFKLSRTKSVVMPYGGDVHIMSHCPNLLFKHAMATDYPQFYERIEETEKQVKRWIRHADHVISGCDWVDYTYHWDTLTLAHFSIDVSKFIPYRQDSSFYEREFSKEHPLKVLHAPNHRTIKGTDFFIKAIEELRTEGYPIELILIQGKSNAEVLQAMSDVDVVADQLIIGWYAMFALEAMSMAKPVICYLRQDLIDLYLNSGNLESVDEIPHINSDFLSIKNTFIRIIRGEISLSKHSEKGLKFVEKYHSIEYIGEVFHKINSSINLPRSGQNVSN